MLVRRGHDIELFESSKKENHWPVCAWGASRHMLERFSSNAGLEFEEFILHVGLNLRMDLPDAKKENLDLKGLVTYDKNAWERALLKDIPVKYGQKVARGSFPMDSFDYVIDCTGLHRSLLPKSKEDFLIPAYEYLVENVEGEDDFYVIGYRGARGYFWYFPLGNGRGFMGAGDVDRRYEGVDEFFVKHPEAKMARKIGRPIRLAPPKRMKPFTDGNIIGVGESIGCVFPMLGEGIIPSLICCDLFLEVLDKGHPFDSELYTEKVLKRFAYYDDVYRIVRLKMECKLSTVKHLNLMMSMYRNMKKEESRFGFEVSFDKMTRLVNAL